MRPRKQQWKACAHPGCPVLVSAQEPCPQHGRPLNAHWSTDRDRGKQRQFRAQVLERDGHACTRCHRSDVPLVAHHVKPGYDVSCGVTLCEDCHKEIDANAR